MKGSENGTLCGINTRAFRSSLSLGKASEERDNTIEMGSTEAILVGLFKIAVESKAEDDSGEVISRTLTRLSPEALAKSAIRAAVNVQESSLALSRYGFAQGVISVAGEVWNLQRINQEYEKYSRERGLDSEGRIILTAIRLQSSEQSLVKDLTVQVFATVLAVQSVLEEIDYDFNAFYSEFGMVDEQGQKKTRVSEVKACESCPCDDFNSNSQDHRTCSCLHNISEHISPANPCFFLVVTLLAIQSYPRLGNKDREGVQKTSILESAACSGNDGGCNNACTDFDQSIGGRCLCGHDVSTHQIVRATFITAIHLFQIVELLYRELEHYAVNPKDKGAITKKKLWSIQPCTKTRCGCKDFEYSYQIPVVWKGVCKCGCSSEKHKFLF